MDKNFFKEWKGDFSNPFAKNQWVQAEGSSLKGKEPQILAKGGIVVHKKCENAVKVFARESENLLWSIIVPTSRLDDLKRDLVAAGFVITS
ncbi:hypothetical protein IJL65_02265 [bacterium]|nr:hypothetical protein [bacterium]